MNTCRAFGCMLAMFLITSVTSAQTDTTVSYQGELHDGGSPAAGLYGMAFSLWDDVAVGSQIGSTITIPDVSVVDGRFTILLDFGDSAFDNSARWLNIVIDETTLVPRQPITRAPYAIQTRGIVVDANQDVGLGTSSPGARLDVVTDTTNAGNNTARFSAPNIGSRTSHIHWGATGDWYIRSADEFGNVLIQDNGGFVGIGTASPEHPLHVVQTGFESEIGIYGEGHLWGVHGHSRTGGRGVYGTTAGGGSGVYGHQSSTGRGVTGWASASIGSTAGVYGQSDSNAGTGVRGWASASSGITYGVRGASSSVAGFDVYADGPGMDYGTNSSIRWKRNIENIDDPMYNLSKLRGVTFDWDEDHGGHHDIGFIAEEVGAVLPEIVQYEANGVDAIGMDYSKLTPLLVEAVNELRVEQNAKSELHESRMTALELENAELRCANAMLEARLERLESLVDSIN